jgi:hypothetical protein
LTWYTSASSAAFAGGVSTENPAGTVTPSRWPWCSSDTHSAAASGDGLAGALAVGASVADGAPSSLSHPASPGDGGPAGEEPGRRRSRAAPSHLPTSPSWKAS